MRLFLSSYKIGDHGDKLHQLVGENKKVAMIINAQDYKIPVERKEKSNEEKADLVRVGFEPFEVDLRDFFDSPIQVEDLKGAGLVWVRGAKRTLRLWRLQCGWLCPVAIINRLRHSRRSNHDQTGL
jgi:dipeptidase E